MSEFPLIIGVTLKKPAAWIVSKRRVPYVRGRSHPTKIKDRKEETRVEEKQVTIRNNGSRSGDLEIRPLSTKLHNTGEETTLRPLLLSDCRSRTHTPLRNIWSKRLRCHIFQNPDPTFVKIIGKGFSLPLPFDGGRVVDRSSSLWPRTGNRSYLKS